MMWFHASGSPAMHQCVQSMPCRPAPPWVRVDPELRQRRDVQQRHRRRHGVEDAPHHGLHRGQACRAPAGRVRGFLQRPRLLQAAASASRWCRPCLALLLLRPTYTQYSSLFASEIRYGHRVCIGWWEQSSELTHM